MDVLLRENETPGKGEWPQRNSQREGGRLGKTGKGKRRTQLMSRRGDARHYNLVLQFPLIHIFSPTISFFFICLVLQFPLFHMSIIR